ncbi:LysR family transcriptional regulator [Nocardioides marmorisolisilvae]|nr:LysR family transcriptional regulator [Nocardioides marmorisolisilvae]
MNIQQLRYVVATVEAGSMTAAATALFVAQPALSRAVRALERELGTDLFARAGRGVVLTAAGESFVARARSVLRSIDRLRDIGDSAEAELVIAATATLQASLALPLLEELRNQGITLHTRLRGCTGAREVHDVVAAGGAALGLCDQAIDSELAVVPIGVAEVRLVSPPGLDLPEVITVADLDGVPLVMPTAGTDRRAALDRFYEACGITPTVAIESDERSVWMEAVLRGLASCIWHSVEALKVPQDGVVFRSFEPRMFQDLSAVHRKDDRTPATVLLLEALREFAELGPGAPVSGSR